MENENRICTTIEQSRLLSGFLPKKSADMVYLDGDETFLSVNDGPLEEDDVPAWSLVALQRLIDINFRFEKTMFDQSGMFTYSFVSDDFGLRTHEHSSQVDAAVEMILMLKDNNLLAHDEKA